MSEKPTRLPDLIDVFSSYFDDDWEPVPAAVEALRDRLRSWLTDGATLDHGVLCVVTAAKTYMNARRALSEDSGDQPSETRASIASWLASEVERFERLSADLHAIQNLAFGINYRIADRTFSYLNRLHSGFFFDMLGKDTFGDDGAGSQFIAQIEAIRRWVDQRLPALRAASESMSERGQKESSPERVLGVTVGREWKHLREEYGLSGSRSDFFEAARSLLIESDVAVPVQVSQMVKAYENHG
jgi:hypothetical protein